MSKQTFATIIGCVLAIALVGVGCGGGSDEGSASDLTKAQFIKRADTLCTKRNEQRDVAIEAAVKKNSNSEDKSGGSVSDIEKLKAVTEVALPPIEVQIEELAELGAPEGDEEQIEEILNGLEKAVEEAEINPVSTLSDKTNPFVRPAFLAVKYGFKICARYA